MSSRNRFIIIGALVGLVLGGTAAWAYAKSQESKQPAARQIRLDAGAPEYVKVGIALIAVVRQVVDLFRPV